MKTSIFFLSALIVTSVFANNNPDYHSRFDGNYELTKIKGSAYDFNTQTCSKPRVTDDNSLDYRNVKCASEAVSLDLNELCPKSISISNNDERVYLDGIGDNLYVSFPIQRGLSDKTKSKSACDGFEGFSGAFGCAMVQVTGLFHEEIKKTSELDEITYSYNTRETGEHQKISLKKINSSIIVSRKGLKRWRGGEYRNPKHYEWNFSCFYRQL